MSKNVSCIFGKGKTALIYSSAVPHFLNNFSQKVNSTECSLELPRKKSFCFLKNSGGGNTELNFFIFHFTRGILKSFNTVVCSVIPQDKDQVFPFSRQH